MSLCTMFLVALCTSAPAPVSFKAEVAPILVTKCLGCHNDQKAANGLNIKTFALLKKRRQNRWRGDPHRRRCRRQSPR